ncbi:hypothetical protein ATY76_09870 [Rhizobium sp. R339]|nr:hypothetical protein ATY76_09870 [Rhizobium sp. R339]
MSRRSVQRFCGNDTLKDKDLKRREREIAMRFRPIVKILFTLRGGSFCRPLHVYGNCRKMER